MVLAKFLSRVGIANNTDAMRVALVLVDCLWPGAEWFTNAHIECLRAELSKRKCLCTEGANG